MASKSAMRMSASRAVCASAAVAAASASNRRVARDAAGRGLSVILCEKDDLAQGTSSRSGKLIHGGLRYLEHYEFRLVREALGERVRKPLALAFRCRQRRPAPAPRHQ